MKSKKYLYLAGVIIVVVVAGIFIVNRKGANAPANNLGDLLIVSPEVSPSASTQVKKVNPSPTPTSSLEVSQLKTYEQWVRELYKLDRWLALNAECTEIVPSGVTYKNNTLVMLDNTLSDKARVLKVGDREYNLEAHGWYLTTLTSKTLPAFLRIDCGPMELGRIELVKEIN
jgi:hypothetical protein